MHAEVSLQGPPRRLLFNEYQEILISLGPRILLKLYPKEFSATLIIMLGISDRHRLES